MSDRVCAVVVTYNRRELLRECLQALLAQIPPLAGILVVDNVSTDGTAAMLSEAFPLARFPQLEVFHLTKNVGGAGGFHEGMKRASAQGFDWLWLLDDDTIVQPGALAELFAARARFAPGALPNLLASKVVWIDGSIHPMNVPRIKRNDLESLCHAALRGTVSLRNTSFVSLLLNRSLVDRYGLPFAEYFIWNDDVEYTARILRHEQGVLVPASTAVHKTQTKHAVGGPRFYYAVRNQLWMIFHSSAWSGEEKVALLGGMAGGIYRYLRESPLSWIRHKAVASGLWDGLFKAPR